MAISDKLTYLNTTKQRLKDSINRLGGFLTSENTFRSYVDELDNIYDILPKVTGTGSDLSLTLTLKGGLSTIPLGNCEQDGTPTPDTPQPIKVVTGDNSVLVQNKNLIDNKNLSYSWANVADSYIQLSSLDTGIRFESTFPGGAPVIAFKLFDLNNYIGKTIRMKSKMTSGGQYRLDLIDENATSVTPIQTASTSEQVISYTVPNNLTDKHYLAFTLIDIVDTSRQIDFTDLILTIDDDDLTYVPHQEQSITLHLGSTYLAGIGDYKDKIVGTKDNWKVVRNVGKYTITSFANKAGTKDNNLYYNGSISSVVVKPSNNLVVVDTFSNYFIKKSTTDIYTNNLQGIAINNQGVINVGFSLSSDYDSLEKVNIWLNTHELILYYQLATPTEETITDTTLINELNELQDLLSYDGTTNITITSDSDNAQMLVQVSALKGE